MPPLPQTVHTTPPVSVMPVSAVGMIDGTGVVGNGLNSSTPPPATRPEDGNADSTPSIALSVKRRGPGFDASPMMTPR